METKAQVWRRWQRGLFVIAGIYVTSVALAFGWLFYKGSVHRRWHDHVNALILELGPKRPAVVTPEQWAHCLQWTWNLHANYGWQSYFPGDQREPFVRDFERHLTEPVNLDTIDQIWDDYARHAPQSNRYMHFRPTTPEMLEQVSPDSVAWLKSAIERKEQESK